MHVGPTVADAAFGMTHDGRDPRDVQVPDEHLPTNQRAPARHGGSRVSLRSDENHMTERVLDVVALYLSDSCPHCSKKGLSYDGGEFALPPGGWSRLLSIARVYGWEPAGTRPPEDDGDELALWKGAPSDWDGRYWPGYGQVVAAKDALDLAAALKRAWPDLPAHGTFEKKIRKVKPGEVYIQNPEVTLQTTPFELYSGDWRQELGMLAAHITRYHCLECAEFRIWSYETG